MSLLTDAIVGIYVGALTGVFPALVAWALAFVFRYFSGVTIPGFGVVVLGVALAGIQGGLMGLLDPNVVNSPTALIALLIVMMATMYAHARGDQMGAEFPRRITLRSLRDRTLSREVVERVGGFGQARIRTAQIADVEGYPPLPEDLRTTIAAREWTFPADLPVSELEDRLANRLTTEYELAETSVSIDRTGRATIAAAPAPGRLSRLVPDGKRAVSVETLVPTGIARGEEVTLLLPNSTIQGTVLSARSGDSGEPPATTTARLDPDEVDAGDDGDDKSDDDAPVGAPRAPTTTGGDGRVTVAVTREEAMRVLTAGSVRLVVRSRGTRREFELVSLLARAGKRFRKLVVGETATLANRTLRETDLRDAHGVVVLAVRSAGTWRLAPDGDTMLAVGDEVIAVGSRVDLNAVQEAM